MLKFKLGCYKFCGLEWCATMTYSNGSAVARSGAGRRSLQRRRGGATYSNGKAEETARSQAAAVPWRGGAAAG